MRRRIMFIALGSAIINDHNNYEQWYKLKQAKVTHVWLCKAENIYFNIYCYELKSLHAENKSKQFGLLWPSASKKMQKMFKDTTEWHFRRSTHFDRTAYLVMPELLRILRHWVRHYSALKC